MAHTKWRASQPFFQCLGHGQVAPVSQGCLNQFVLHAEVLKPVIELGVGHVDGELLQDIRFLGVKVESHLGEPVEVASVRHFVGDQHPCGVSLVNQLRNLNTTTGGQEMQKMYS